MKVTNELLQKKMTALAIEKKLSPEQLQDPYTVKELVSEATLIIEKTPEATPEKPAEGGDIASMFGLDMDIIGPIIQGVMERFQVMEKDIKDIKTQNEKLIELMHKMMKTAFVN